MKKQCCLLVIFFNGERLLADINALCSGCAGSRISENLKCRSSEGSTASYLYQQKIKESFSVYHLKNPQAGL